MAKQKKKKPVNKRQKVKTILEVSAYIATIVGTIYQLLKG